MIVLTTILYTCLGLGFLASVLLFFLGKKKLFKTLAAMMALAVGAIAQPVIHASLPPLADFYKTLMAIAFFALVREVSPLDRMPLKRVEKYGWLVIAVAILLILTNHYMIGRPNLWLGGLYKAALLGVAIPPTISTFLGWRRGYQQCGFILVSVVCYMVGHLPYEVAGLLSLSVANAVAASSLVAALGLALVACLVHYARESQDIFATTVLSKDRLATALSLNADKLTLLENKLTDEKIRSVNSARKVALGEMAGGIAHEINNPLAIIRCYVDFIEIETKKAMGQNAQVTKAVSVMGRAVDRMAEIVSDLRKLTADDHRAQHKVNQLDEILVSAIQFCQRRFLTHNVALEITRIPTDVMVTGEREQLIQVLLNLLQNSFKEVSQLEDSWIKVDYKVSGDRIQIRVTDSGKGIDDAIAEKIFQPFFTTRVVGKGVGLGLSVSLGIVESHNGSLFLDRAHPNTRFIIELPILKCDKDLQQTA